MARKLTGNLSVPASGKHRKGGKLPRVAATKGPTRQNARLQNKPVFVHSGFRASSTWFWNLLRRAPNTIAYCEYFHEILADITPERIAEVGPESWHSGHPVGAPYFLEFLPLLNNGMGVKDYRASMAFDRYIPEGGINGPLSPDEISYIEFLLGHCRDGGRVGVFTETRSLGRAKAIASHFSSYNILLVRNLYHQWASYSDQSVRGNNYFLATIDRILKASRQDSFLSSVDDLFHNRRESPLDEGLFQSFVLLHLYLVSRATEVCDIVVDISRICQDTKHRRYVENKLSKIVGSPIDLGSVQDTFSLSLITFENRAAIRDVIEHGAKLIDATLKKESSSTFLKKYVEDFFYAWDKHQYYASGIRQIRKPQLVTNSKQTDASRLDSQYIPLMRASSAIDGPLLDIHDARIGITDSREFLSEERRNRAAEGERNILELQQAKERALELEQASESLSNELGRLREEKNLILQERNEISAVNHNYVGEIQQLSAQSAETAVRYNAFCVELANAVVEKQQLLVERDAAISAYRKAEEEAKQAKEQIEILSKKNSSISAEHAATVVERDRYVINLDEEKSLSASIVGQLDQATNLNAALAVQVNNLTLECDELRSSNESDALRLNDILAENSTIRLENDLRLSRLATALRDLDEANSLNEMHKAAIHRLDRDVEPRIAEIDALTHRVDAMAAELAACRTENTEFLIEMERLQDRLALALRREEAFRNEAACWQTKNASLQVEIERLQDSLALALRREEAFRNEAACWQTKNASLQVEIERLQDSLALTLRREEKFRNEAAGTDWRLRDSERNAMRSIKALSKELKNALEIGTKRSDADKNAMLPLGIKSTARNAGDKGPDPTALRWFTHAIQYFGQSKVNAARQKLVLESGLFDPSWYKRRYRDVAESNIDPLVHFTIHGSHELRDPGPDFNTESYLVGNPDVATARVEPFFHYLVYGRFECRAGWRIKR